jgi:hypothetical protein
VFAVARFVTIKAIALNLCVHVPLGKSNSLTSLILGLATRGPKPKTIKSATPELMAGSSPNFYHRYI